MSDCIFKIGVTIYLSGQVVIDGPSSCNFVVINIFSLLSGLE
jgi:hypothetical protein